LNQEQKQWGIRVPREKAETVRRLLIRRSILEKSLRPYSDRTFVIFPVKSTENLPKDESYGVVQHPFVSRRIYPNLDKKLIALLPADLYELRPRSFDILGGKIVVIQLHDSLLGFSKAIAQALVDMGFSSVYLRTSQVEGPFRLRRLQLLHGEPIERLIHKENGVNIVVSLKTTYFNPRLSTEHERIVQVAEQHERVLDMFTGVGPFALQLAKHRSASVDAWDINTDAIACLRESISLNRINPKKIRTKIGDARDLVEGMESGIFDRVLMNLPGESVNYIHAALSACRKGGMIHYYRFGDTESSGSEVIDEFNHTSAQYGFKIAHNRTHRVREVAPGRTHYCCNIRKLE
jgi:tRNA (guanine37-N1)-methyltransferase